MKNSEKKFSISQEGEVEKKIEEERFEPQIIFDFIRHGQAVYGKEVKKKMVTMGYDWEKVMPTSCVSSKEEGGRAAYEGRVTKKGEKQLREAIGSLIRNINPDKENIMLLFGPRFRTVDSSRIILEQLEKRGVNVYKARIHRDLIDTKKHWLSILEFVKEKTDKTDQPFQHWLKMSEQELKEADLEGLSDVKQRMNHLVRLIQRYARRYHSELGLDNKTLRVIAATHDINIMSVLPEEEISPDRFAIIKNAQIVELSIDKKGEKKITAQ